MQLLASLAALLGVEVDVLVERMRRNALIYAALGLFSVIGLVFLLVAAHVALSDWVGPLWSALIIAGTALLITAIIWLWADAAERARQRRAAERRRATDATALATTAAVAALPMLIRNPALRLVAIPVGAVLAYLVLSRMRGKPEDE